MSVDYVAQQWMSTLFFYLVPSFNNNVSHSIRIDSHMMSFLLRSFLCFCLFFSLVIVVACHLNYTKMCQYMHVRERVYTLYFDGRKLLFSPSILFSFLLLFALCFLYHFAEFLHACIMQYKASQSSTCSWINAIVIYTGEQR